MLEYYIARNEDGILKLYCDLPKKSDFGNYWVGNLSGGDIKLDNDLFPELIWGMEPIQVNLKIELNERISNSEISEEQSTEISQVPENVDGQSNSESD